MLTRSVVAVYCSIMPVLALACTPRETLGQQSVCIVGRVVDGDTFVCRDGRKVRLTGVDTPERRQGWIAVSAHRTLARMLPAGTAARLELDVRPTDRYGRVLAYVWVDSTFVNETMVRTGWAVLYTVPPNVRYAERFSRAQEEARAQRAGLWRQNGFACLPGDFRRGVCVSSP